MVGTWLPIPLRGGSPSSSGGGRFDNRVPKLVAPRPGVAEPEGADDDDAEEVVDRVRSFSLK